MPSPREIRAARVEHLTRQLMALVNASTVPSGILVAPPAQSPMLDRVRGNPSDPPLSRQAWRDVYFQLHKGAFSASPAAVSLPSLDSIEERAAQLRKAGLIPIAIGHYDYHTPTHMFTSRMRQYVESGGEPPEAESQKPEAVLQEKSAFFVAPLLEPEYHLFSPKEPVYRALSARFVVPSSLYLSNVGTAPSQLEVDLDDGQGFRSITPDVPFDGAWTKAGTKNIRVRVNAGGQELEAATQLQTALPLTPSFQEHWLLTSPIAYQGVTATGHAWVFYGKGHQSIVNPLIVAEGFPGGYPLGTLWEILDEQNFAKNILADGYDLIILGFDSGISYVEANAGVAIAAIQRTITERKSSQPLVVGGASMGGLVTRYALTYMEANGLDHQTGLYFSFDSPHLGALVPASALYFASYFASYSDAAAQANSILTSTAAQEMLIYSLSSYNDKPAVPSKLRTTMVDNLNALGGMPKKCRKIGVANGTGTGVGNGVPPATEMLTFSAWCAGASLYSAPGIETDSQPNVIADLRVGLDTNYYPWSFPPNVPCNFDGVPGGTDNFMQQLATGLISGGYSPTDSYPISCFMPSISACALYDLSLYSNADLCLDFAGGGQPSLLDEYFYSATNYPHVTVTPEIASWLLNQLGHIVPQAAGIVVGSRTGAEVP